MKSFKALVSSLLTLTCAWACSSSSAIAHGAILSIHAAGLKFIAPHNHFATTPSPHSNLVAATTFHRLPGFSGSASNFYNSAKLLQNASFSQGTLASATRIITSGQINGTFYEDFSGTGTAFERFPNILDAIGSNPFNSGTIGVVTNPGNFTNSFTFAGSGKAAVGLIPPAHLVGPGSARALQNVYHNIAIGSYNAGVKTGFSNVIGGQLTGTAYERFVNGNTFQTVSRFVYSFGNVPFNTQLPIASGIILSNPTSFLLLANGKTLSLSNAFVGGTLIEGFGTPPTFYSTQGFWALAVGKNAFNHFGGSSSNVTIPSTLSFFTH